MRLCGREGYPIVEVPIFSDAAAGRIVDDELRVRRADVPGAPMAAMAGRVEAGPQADRDDRAWRHPAQVAAIWTARTIRSVAASLPGERVVVGDAGRGRDHAARHQRVRASGHRDLRAGDGRAFVSSVAASVGLASTASGTSSTSRARATRTRSTTSLR